VSSVIVYHIVKIGEPPGNQASDSEDATCYAWSLMRGKDQMEVVAADLLTGEVTHRYSQVESERAASIFRDPRIR
jgi:hypothetical protein